MARKNITEKVKSRRGRKKRLRSKYTTAEEFRLAVDEYFRKCDEEKKPPTVSGLALALGFLSRQTLLNYEDEDRNKDINGNEKQKIIAIIKEARLKIEKALEESLLTGKQVAGVIFNLKNNFGYVDKIETEGKSEIVITVNGVDKF